MTAARKTEAAGAGGDGRADAAELVIPDRTRVADCRPGRRRDGGDGRGDLRVRSSWSRPKASTATTRSSSRSSPTDRKGHHAHRRKGSPYERFLRTIATGAAPEIPDPA
jgi:hypothetical protein